MLGCDGTGTGEQILDGMDWVAQNTDGTSVAVTINDKKAAAGADLLLAPADSLNPLQQRLRSQLEPHLPSHAPLATPWPRWGRSLSVLAAVLLAAALYAVLAAPGFVSDRDGTAPARMRAAQASLCSMASRATRPAAQ